MPALFVFLLKVNIALLLFCAGYFLVLRHLTFYTLNRIYLVGAILFATVYPQIDLNDFALRHQQLAKPVAIVLYLQKPAETLVKPLAQPAYWHWLGVVFWLGVVLLAIRLLLQIVSLYKLHRGSIPMKIRDHKVRVMHGNSAPFSFWRSIYVNPANHEPGDLKAILLHEQIHVNEWHTLDILLAELSAIFYWFNPGVWLMKRAVRENIEFITDRKILNNGIDSKQYQYSLVNVSFSASPQTIVNHFNLSTIKKRIIMMNAKRSPNTKLARYALLTPAVVALLLVFSVSRAALVAKSKTAIHRLEIAIKPATLLQKIQNEITIDALTPAKAVTKPAVKDTNKITKSFTISIHIDSNQKLKTDTTLHYKFNYSISIDTNYKSLNNNTKHTDAVVEPQIYFIDGRMVKKSDLNNMNPDDVTSVKVGASPTSKLALVNITTKNNTHQPITKVRLNGNNLAMTDVTIDSVVDKNRPIVVAGYRNRDTAMAGRSYSIRGVPMTSAPVKILNILTPGKASGLNNLADKMFIIDGKIATEKDMKKLAAFDIDKMYLRNDEQTKLDYGDKAKNGVVFITTKKAAKSK